MPSFRQSRATPAAPRLSYVIDDLRFFSLSLSLYSVMILLFLHLSSVSCLFSVALLIAVLFL